MLEDEAFSLCLPGGDQATELTRVVIALYIRSLVYGCGEKTCSMPFCATNYDGELTNQGIVLMASNLARSQGIHGLCDLLLDCVRKWSPDFVANYKQSDFQQNLPIDSDYIWALENCSSTETACNSSLTSSRAACSLVSNFTSNTYMHSVQRILDGPFKDLVASRAAIFRQYIVENCPFFDEEFQVDKLEGMSLYLLYSLIRVPWTSEKPSIRYNAATANRDIKSSFKEYPNAPSMSNVVRVEDGAGGLATFKLVDIRYGDVKENSILSETDKVNKSERLLREFRWLNYHDKCYSLMQTLSFAVASANMDVDMSNEELVNYYHSKFCSFFVDRSDYLSSTFLSMKKTALVGGGFKRPLRVYFVGGEEVALDQGGVQKEFFSQLGIILNNSRYFEKDSISNYAWFSDNFTGDVREYEYIGLLFGLSVYNCCTISIDLPDFFYKLLLLQINDIEIPDVRLEQLADFLPGQMSSVINLSKLSDIELQSLDMLFERPMRNVSLPLKSFTDCKKVNKANIGQFQHEFAQSYLFKDRFASIARGFKAMFGSLDYIRTYEQLRLLIEGEKIIDIVKLVDSGLYRETPGDQMEDVFTENSLTVKHLREILSEYDNSKRIKFLEFVTGSRRLTADRDDGLSNAILIERNGTDIDKLPGAMTCMNMLMLPDYKNKQLLRDMLDRALEYPIGFGVR